MIPRILFPLLLLALHPGGAAALAVDCEQLAAAAGAAEGLPDGLLPAISRVEAGRATGDGGTRGWPWTLNQGGKGMFFETQEEALAYLDQALIQGVTNIDVGCMQLNHRWHSAAFPSTAAMIDPPTNTRYAALFLRKLYESLGSWEAATAAYHSQDPDRGAAYRDKVLAAMGEVDAGPPLDYAALDPTLAEAAPRARITGSVTGILLLPGAPLVASAAVGLTTGTAPEGEAPPTPATDPITGLAASLTRPRGEPRWEDEGIPALLDQTDLSPRMQQQWVDIAAMRDLLALQP